MPFFLKTKQIIPVTKRKNFIVYNNIYLQAKQKTIANMFDTYAFLKEVLTTPAWNIEYTRGAILARQLRTNLLAHSPFTQERTADKTTNKMEVLVCKSADRKQFERENATRLISQPMYKERAELFTSKVMVGNARELVWWDELEEDDQVINLLHVEGPITRNGGACSYGSKDIRDQMLFCAEMPNCIGHILILDSPGGSAFSSNDFEQATDAVRNAHQPSIGLIDGICASACLDLSTMLDEVYFTHPKDMVGSVGTYMCDFTLKNGDQNTVTQEVFREVYADVSEDKNLIFRQLAEGDESGVKEWVNKYAEEFRERVKARRPETPDEWLHGKTFDASETIGIWTQGQSNLQGCIERILQLNSPR